MTGNNSCGSRSIRYGNMVHNVRAVDAVLADGSLPLRPGAGDLRASKGRARIASSSRRSARSRSREAEEIEHRYPKLLRRVGGYNLDMMLPAPFNMAHLLVGPKARSRIRSASTRLLAAAEAQDARRVPLPELLQGDGSAAAHREAEPVAVELVDRR
jgi:FAD/FMN-containing dehydrogenase